MTSAPLVCVVDDADDYRFLIKQLFSRYLPAYPVSFFTDGKDLLEGLSQLTILPNLILLDRHMPVLDGHQTLIHLKKHPVYKKIPVVMMSADASTAEINACYEACANSILRKSMEFDSMKSQMSIVCQYWLEMNLKAVQKA